MPFEQLRGSEISLEPARLEQGGFMEWDTPGDGFAQRLILADRGTAQVTVALIDDRGELLTTDIDFPSRHITFNRHPSPLCPSGQFARTTTTRMAGASSVELDIIFDGSLIEILVDGGRRVYSATVFPQGPVRLSVSAVSGTVQIEHGAIGRSIDFAT